MAKPAFRTGAQAAEEAAPKGGGGDYGFFALGESDEGIVIRYLTDSDGWITVDQHYAETRSKPKDWPKGSNWPRGMSAVCRRDPALRDLYDDCYICDHVTVEEDGETKPNKAKPRTWALVALREEVREEGKVVGVRDVMEDGPDGEQVPRVLIVNQAYSNFFSNAQAFAGRYDTVLDRDYFVDRTGKGNQTNYPHVPLDPVTIDLGGDDGEIEWDVRNESILDYYIAGRDSLEDVVFSKSSDRFYDLFFDERHEQPAIKKKDDEDESSESKGGSSKAPKGVSKSKAKADDSSDESDESEEKPSSNGSTSTAPDPDKLAAIRARVSKG